MGAHDRQVNEVDFPNHVPGLIHKRKQVFQNALPDACFPQTLKAAIYHHPLSMPLW
jgi:hypothetical protein